MISFTFTVEDLVSGETKQKKFNFMKSSEISVENIKRVLGVKEENKLEVIKDSTSYEINIEEDLSK